MPLERFVCCACGADCGEIRPVASVDEQRQLRGRWIAPPCHRRLVAARASQAVKPAPAVGATRSERRRWVGAIPTPATVAKIAQREARRLARQLASNQPPRIAADLDDVTVTDVLAYARGRSEGWAAGYRAAEDAREGER